MEWKKIDSFSPIIRISLSFQPMEKIMVEDISRGERWKEHRSVKGGRGGGRWRIERRACERELAGAWVEHGNGSNGGLVSANVP